MEIKSVDIKYFYYNGFSMTSNDNTVHIKSLPYLSIVQSKIGSYGIRLDNSNEYETGEGNFFIAPSMVNQKITHYLNKNEKLFYARYLFLDVIINQKYRLDDVFDLPVIMDKTSNEIINSLFDEYESADCVCDKMKCLYDIIKLLMSISTKKPVFRNNGLYPLIDFIKNNYAQKISISEMAGMLNMSESNLYSVFKKAIGISPLKYLNEYRLSVAAAMLLQTDDSIKIIAEKVGIEDQFYFSKSFKAKYHMSPQKYRKEQY